MKRSITASLAVCLLIVGADAFSANVPKGLQGTWSLSAGESDGKGLTEQQLKDGKLEIVGDAFTVALANRETVKGTQTVDATKEPMTLDIADSTGPNKGKTCLAIYELSDDTFRVAVAPPGKARPTSFTTHADSGQWMHVWKRVK